MNQAADLPTACSAIPTSVKADEPKSFSTIAAARQYEKNVSITEVATTIRTRFSSGIRALIGVT